MDWQEVAISSPGGGYEWDTFDVRWTGDHYAWSRQSGCSCVNFVYDEDQYKHGDIGELNIAIVKWNGGWFGNITDSAWLLEKVHGWNTLNHS